MKQTVVRYRTRTDKTQDNEALIRGVFEELRAKTPDGVRYLVLRLADGSFVHFVMTDATEGPSPLSKLDAFRAFTTAIRERTLEPPQSQDAVIVGHYRMLAEPRRRGRWRATCRTRLSRPSRRCDRSCTAIAPA